MKRFVLFTFLLFFHSLNSSAIEKIHRIDTIDSRIKANFVKQGEILINDLVYSSDKKDSRGKLYVFNILRSSLYEAQIEVIDNLNLSLLGVKEELHLFVQDEKVFLNRKSWINDDFDKDIRPLVISALLQLNGISDEKLVSELYLSIVDSELERGHVSKAPYCDYSEITLQIEKKTFKKKVISSSSVNDSKKLAISDCQGRGLMDCRILKSGSRGVLKWKKYFSIYRGEAHSVKIGNIQNTIDEYCTLRRSCRQLYDQLSLSFDGFKNLGSLCTPY